MIFGAHMIVCGRDAEADRAFLRDVLGFSSVDAGHRWLIYALPPAELAVHPAAARATVPVGPHVRHPLGTVGTVMMLDGSLWH